MNETLEKWIDELGDELELINSPEVNTEANNNMYTFGIKPEWGKDSVTTFINQCSEIYASKTNGQPMWFYSWYDDQAFQLRISAVSQSHKKLPFRCKLNSVSLSQVAQDAFNNNNGITSQGKLNVWQTNI